MEYKGVEAIIKIPYEPTADPLYHPVDVSSIGVKKDDRGVWVSVAQIVSLLAWTMGHEIPYELEDGELELKC